MSDKIIECCQQQQQYDVENKADADCARFVRSVANRLSASIDPPVRKGNAGVMFTSVAGKTWPFLSAQDAYLWVESGILVIAAYVNISAATSHVVVVTRGTPKRSKHFFPYGYWEMQGSPVLLQGESFPGACHGTLDYSFKSSMYGSIQYAGCLALGCFA